MGPKCYAVQCIVKGKKTSKIALSPWDFVTPPEEDHAMAIGNMHKNLVKIARVVREICARWQTDRHTHTDALMTILRHRSRGRSNNVMSTFISRTCTIKC